mmetsp:Transcript_28374/g.42177  ORF Transcript_28374/g.42177 Transcript_28374/m.42177 type:complete len:105 (+) Transcript_28374:731-1045(+)
MLVKNGALLRLLILDRMGCRRFFRLLKGRFERVRLWWRFLGWLWSKRLSESPRHCGLREKKIWILMRIIDIVICQLDVRPHYAATSRGFLPFILLVHFQSAVPC